MLCCGWLMFQLIYDFKIKRILSYVHQFALVCNYNFRSMYEKRIEYVTIMFYFSIKRLTVEGQILPLHCLNLTEKKPVF